MKLPERVLPLSVAAWVGGGLLGAILFRRPLGIAVTAGIVGALVDQRIECAQRRLGYVDG